MSTITFTCPHCQSQTNFPSTAVGQQGKCSGCLQNVTIQLDPTPPATNPAAKKKLIIFATVGCGAVVVLPVLVVLGFFLYTTLSLMTPPANTNALDEEQLTEQPVESSTNTIGMQLNLIPAGTFIMGSPETEKDRGGDEHQHRVTITKAFYMQTTEVTQGQWKAVMGTEPWRSQDNVKEGASYPATYVSWDNAVAYCNKLSEKEGKTYRLPTEAEWEYACRAGTQTTWSFGNDEKVLGDYAWYRKNAWDIDEEYAHQVELKKPNAFGLYDMHGNVWEWCHDYYEEDYYKQSPEQDPMGPARNRSSRQQTILRGGTMYSLNWPRSANRGMSFRFRTSFGGGFRVVRELD
jgi:formylglycine-generating enzyme required for sulfatase activity